MEKNYLLVFGVGLRELEELVFFEFLELSEFVEVLVFDEVVVLHLEHLVPFVGVEFFLGEVVFDFVFGGEQIRCAAVFLEEVSFGGV